MVYFALVLLGLCLGSFVNALVWRLYKQDQLFAEKPPGMGKKSRELSIVHGRSMCMHCGHELVPKDLVPVFSWLFLRGRCRYCRAKIDDTPVAELILPILFVVSYAVWPYALNGWSTGEISAFVLWLGILTGYLALTIYDAKWLILPDRVVWPVTAMAAVTVIALASAYNDGIILANALAGAAIISGLFFGIAYFNDKWMGGGDVKLGISLGLLAGTPVLAFMLIFIASVLGTLAALPKIILGKGSLKTMLPFGPFLMIAAFIVFLWGADIYDWYFGLLI